MDKSFAAGTASAWFRTGESLVKSKNFYFDFAERRVRIQCANIERSSDIYPIGRGLDHQAVGESPQGEPAD